MSTLAKTIVATGATSGLGFDLVKQLLAQAQPHRFILGARDTKGVQTALDGLKYDTSKHSVTVIPVQLNNLKTVKSFAQQTLEKLGQTKIDYLLLNAATAKNADEPGPFGSKWCEAYIVNHLSQHYLIHLLREKLEADQSRVVVVSSGAVRNVEDPSLLEADVKGASKTTRSVYSAAKFIQLLGAQWWRRQLLGKCDVVAVSPGLIPGTGLSRDMAPGTTLPFNHPDAKSVSEGAQNVYRAFTRDDLPEDPEQMFLTSWGEWWPKDVYKLTLDKDLQEKFSPSEEQIEKEEGIAA
ncbi:NAD(P)-binding protein [Xylariomycetidae sp. FL2044]|nr:NAD(P)-binding protein [Xylariomycetidae sp. FL2044]